MLKNIIGIIIICLISLSCVKKTDNRNLDKQENEIMAETVSNIVNKSFNVSEEIYNILSRMEEKYLKNEFTEILFIHKINFGIPDGDNYIILWKREDRGYYETIVTSEIYLYSISDKIERRYYIPAALNERGNDLHREGDNLAVNIMNNIPGIHIARNVGASFFDINGDGKDELFSYSFGGMNWRIEIYGYDAGKNEIVNYCDNNIEFWLYDEDVSTPVEFTRYNNLNGFKVFCESIQSVPTMNLINNNFAWYFCSWDNGENKYKIVKEYLVDEAGGEFDMEFNIYDYPIEHFENRINNWSNIERIKSFKELSPRIDGGRSFHTTIYDVSLDKLYERIWDFDHEGNIILKY